MIVATDTGLADKENEEEERREEDDQVKGNVRIKQASANLIIASSASSSIAAVQVLTDAFVVRSREKLTLCLASPIGQWKSSSS